MRRVVWHTQNDPIPKCLDLRNNGQKKSGLQMTAAPLVVLTSFFSGHVNMCPGTHFVTSIKPCCKTPLICNVVVLPHRKSSMLYVGTIQLRLRINGQYYTSKSIEFFPFPKNLGRSPSRGERSSFFLYLIYVELRREASVRVLCR